MKDYITEEKRKTPILKNYDTVVVGGGIAGISAALAAARNGAKTLLAILTHFTSTYSHGFSVIHKHNSFLPPT